MYYYIHLMNLYLTHHIPLMLLRLSFNILAHNLGLIMVMNQDSYYYIRFSYHTLFVHHTYMAHLSYDCCYLDLL